MNLDLTLTLTLPLTLTLTLTLTLFESGIPAAAPKRRLLQTTPQ